MSLLYETLLRSWGDGLLRLQAEDRYGAGVAGGILCPACARIHGRCGDAVYPLLRLARTTGEARFREAAVRLQAWTEHVSRAGGAWANEPTGNEWTGITVFGLLALGEAVRHHGALLAAPVRARWEARTRAAAEFLLRTFTIRTGNINYPVTCTAALAVAGELFADARYTHRARDLAHECLGYITADGLLFGEGHPQDGRSPRGCRTVDLGYNVEESLPALALYGILTGDEAVLAATTRAWQTHLAFLLPDGGWDNSWGTRNFKWTYWGSRTSDGCQAGLLLLADRDPAFAAAAMRNTALLAACTHDGLLYGGPHLHAHGELPCVHHTVTHAKALAAALDYGGAHLAIPVASPLPIAQGLRAFPELLTWLVGMGPWRGTVTAYDWVYLPQGHVSGGTLSLLWHTAVGPVITAGMVHYSTASEPSNMPVHREAVNVSLGPQIRLQTEDATFSSLSDRSAEVRVLEEGAGVIALKAQGQVVTEAQQAPAGCCTAYAYTYRFTATTVTIQVQGPAGAEFLLPVITAPDEPVREDGETLEITKPGGRVRIAASHAPVVDGRIFNHTPGHAAILLRYRLAGPVTVQISVAP
jgi:hypothetical protein